MAGRRKPNPVLEDLEITAIAAEGNSLGRVNDKVVFVPFTIPGDVVDIQVRTSRKRFMEGYVLRYKKFSEDRVDPFCLHFGVCGGCRWQMLPYERQLEYKKSQVEDQLSRIAKVELPPVEDTVGSEATRFYRNKLEFTFSPKRWLTREEVESGVPMGEPRALGLHIPGMFDKVLDLKECWLQAEPSNSLRLSVREFCIGRDIEFYDARSHQGMMRNMIIRTSTTGEVMVIVVFGRRETEVIAAVLEHIGETFPQVTSLMYVVNEKLNDSIADQRVELWAGRDHIFEAMGDLRFKIGPKSFYQTNSHQAEQLYRIAAEMAALRGAETVYDLYTGTGTIANYVARSCGRVIGIEYVPEAVEDARENSSLNGITNTEFHAGDMKDVLSDAFIAEKGRPDVIIVDPPRAGMHDEVTHTILRAAPQRIVYVSCNPATQARDIAILDAEYAVRRIVPVDMFPHTHHVENVVLLERR